MQSIDPGPTPSGRQLTKSWGFGDLVPGLSLCLVGLAYLPLAFVRFAFSDDYALMAIHGFRAVNPYLIGDGRVLGGLLCAALFTIFDTVEFGAVLRLIGLAELLICLALIQRAMRVIGFEGGWTAFVAILFAASPTVQNWVVWGVSAWQLPALVLGLLAFFAWQGIIASDGRLSPRHAAAFVGLQVAAMLVYQPFAVAAWPILAISLMMNRDMADGLRRCLVSLCCLAAVLAATFAITKVLIWLCVPVAGHDRTRILAMGEAPEKLAWLLANPLPFVFSYVRDTPTPAIVAAALCLIGLGIVVGSRSALQSLWIVALACGGALIAALPSLASAETTPVRTYVVLALMACLILAFSLRRLMALFSLEPRIANAVVAGLLVAVLVRAGLHVMRQTAWPQAAELSAVERLIARTDLPPGRPAVVIGLPDGTSLTGKGCDIVMIGCASSGVRHALPNMVRLWLRHEGRDTKPGALFFARQPDDPTVFSFEPDRSAIVPAPLDPVYVDVRGPVLAVATSR